MQIDKANQLKKKKVDEEPEIDQAIQDELNEVALEIENRINNDGKTPFGQQKNDDEDSTERKVDHKQLQK